MLVNALLVHVSALLVLVNALLVLATVLLVFVHALPMLVSALLGLVRALFVPVNVCKVTQIAKMCFPDRIFVVCCYCTWGATFDSTDYDHSAMANVE